MVVTTFKRDFRSCRLKLENHWAYCVILVSWPMGHAQEAPLAGEQWPWCLLRSSPRRGQPRAEGEALRVGTRGSGFWPSPSNDQLWDLWVVTSSSVAQPQTDRLILWRLSIKMTCIQGDGKTLSIRQMHVIIKEPYFSQIKFKIRGTTWETTCFCRVGKRFLHRL